MNGTQLRIKMNTDLVYKLMAFKENNDLPELENNDLGRAIDIIRLKNIELNKLL